MQPQVSHDEKRCKIQRWPRNTEVVRKINDKNFNNNSGECCVTFTTFYSNFAPQEIPKQFDVML